MRSGLAEGVGRSVCDSVAPWRDETRGVELVQYVHEHVLFEGGEEGEEEGERRGEEGAEEEADEAAGAAEAGDELVHDLDERQPGPHQERQPRLLHRGDRQEGRGGVEGYEHRG